MHTQSQTRVSAVIVKLCCAVFPNQLRGPALAISGATNWAANFTVTVTFLPLIAIAGLGGAYAFYAVAAAISLVFVWPAVRETKAKRWNK